MSTTDPIPLTHQTQVSQEIPRAAIFVDLDHASSALRLDRGSTDEQIGLLKTFCADIITHTRQVLHLEPFQVSLHAARTLPPIALDQMVTDGRLTSSNTVTEVARCQRQSAVIDTLPRLKLDAPMSISWGHLRYRGLGSPPQRGRVNFAGTQRPLIPMFTQCRVDLGVAMAILRATILPQASGDRRAANVVVVSGDDDLNLVFRRLIPRRIGCHYITLADGRSSTRLVAAASSVTALAPQPRDNLQTMS
ncbi:MAG: hypothetical protein J0H82_29280 [Alphaproteobacteria bacterium]|jgi:hypothetical protein|nr:hypothetical protein [Alphaproteobacteria bacterium]